MRQIVVMCWVKGADEDDRDENIGTVVMDYVPTVGDVLCKTLFATPLHDDYRVVERHALGPYTVNLIVERMGPDKERDARKALLKSFYDLYNTVLNARGGDFPLTHGVENAIQSIYRALCDLSEALNEKESR